ncbi:hypothetical protein K470DRAFT_214335 [Piedraia hortae CBS 480.64]|uniref:Uncharacterized protein n=1 Tax=Piedraia hortae CBS 480.64 TaxID=1314780 RepID=A0A6A7C2V4_9PEZI|nr:hypothetical protein K470DRAFT_214335 [Piedraia hortae CBS 480.64]
MTSLTQCPSAWPKICSDPPVYSISADALSQAIEHLAAQPLPPSQQVFPWLHGLHRNNRLQMAFFAANEVNPPTCLRGLTLVKTGGDLSHSKLKGAVDPLSILVPGAECFRDADPRCGFGLRNFHIQLCKMAAISDIIVYHDELTPRANAERLAHRIARAQAAQKNSGFNTFLVSDSWTTIEERYPRLIALNSRGEMPSGVINFAMQERIELCRMSAPSQISYNVWLGPTPDRSIPIISDVDFDVMIETNEMACIPDSRGLEKLHEMLQEMVKQKEIGDLATGVVPQIEFPSSGSPKFSEVGAVNGLLDMCRWVYEKANGLSDTPMGRRDSKLMGDGRRILIHCVDGYTDSSLLALAYLMFSECISAAEAWIRLHRDLKRNFFAYPGDAVFLHAIQDQIVRASPSWRDCEAQLHCPNEPWFEQSDGSLPSRIMDHLYLGNLVHANNADMLRRLGITRVLSVGEPADWSDEERSRWPADELLYIDKVQDNGIDALMEEFPRCLEFIDSGRKKGAKTLVHCRVGVSRSATICIAAVMRELNLSFPRAYCYVRARRLNIIIQPHLRFVYELLQWEKTPRELDWATISHEIAMLNMPYVK